MRTRFLAGLALAVVLFSGCNRDRKKTIAVIPKSTAHLYWVSVHAGALKAAQEFNVDIEWIGPAKETEFDRQIQIVDAMIARRVDGIALAANEKQALVGPVERAAKAGIPVAMFDSGIESDRVLTFLATNNYEAGQMAGRTLAKELKGEGVVAVVGNGPGSGSTIDRERGFEDAIAREFPKIKVLGVQYSMGDHAKARAIAENFLTANPALTGMFASAEFSAMGVSAALKARNLVGKVKVIGFDSSEAMIEDLKAGAIQGTVVQEPFRMGYESVRLLVESWSGKKPQKQIDLPARVILADDLEKPEIKELLHPDISKYLK